MDDGSTDDTCRIIESFDDGRVLLMKHKTTQGVLRSFEDAIRRARGDILFLSDQDDIWAADKVSIVLEAFRMHPESDIAVSDAALIDDTGSPIAPSYYAQRGKFRSGLVANVFRCSYLGCTMAFRGRIRNRILPFPTGADVLHDVWIGTVNSLAGGKTLYIDHPLVFYRRHAGNATGNRRLSVARQIRIRWALSKSLASSWLNSHRTREK